MATRVYHSAVASGDTNTQSATVWTTHTSVTFTPDANSAVNVAQIGGSNVSTAASGVQKVGIVGNAGGMCVP